jgi:hypothetical protein
VGTVAFGAGQQTGTVTCSSAINFMAGDLISFIAPGSQDATLSDISITLSGTR